MDSCSIKYGYSSRNSHLTAWVWLTPSDCLPYTAVLDIYLSYQSDKGSFTARGLVKLIINRLMHWIYSVALLVDLKHGVISGVTIIEYNQCLIVYPADYDYRLR